MVRLIVKRLLQGILALIGAMLLIFILARFMGDPRYVFIGQEGKGYSPEAWERAGEKLGLDKPAPVQFVYWLGNILRGDFGDSVSQQRRVLHIIRLKAPNTIQLGASAWLVGTLLGVPMGVFSATSRGKFVDYVLRGFAFLGQALPVFWVGIVLIFIFAVQLHWLPAGTKGDGISIKNFILPAITLGWLPAASYLRLTRTAMLDVLDSEYVRLARGKGVGRFTVVWKHAFRNAIIPPLTLSAFVLFGFMSGTVIVETVFSWPGLGRLAVDALWASDFPLLTGITVIWGAAFVVLIILLDILYAIVDPRIKYA